MEHSYPVMPYNTVVGWPQPPSTQERVASRLLMQAADHVDDVAGPPPGSVCVECGGPLKGKRRSKRFCSGKCRVENHREARLEPL